jgi:hypothetical protein
MITEFKIFEYIEWYSKGEFTKEEEPIKKFQVGDVVISKITTFWQDNTYINVKTSLKNEGYWEKSGGTRKVNVTKVDYCDDLQGYTGQVIQVDDGYWPWFQSEGFELIDDK